MPNSLSINVQTHKAIAGLKQLERDTDRATMWALRAVGRKVKQEARRRAPVYGGTTKSMSVKARHSVSVGSGKHIAIVPGLLKNSISSSRRFRHEGRGVFLLSVAPRGGHVHLYAAKQERRTPYMEPARQIAESLAPALHAKAWNAAMRKAGRL